MLAPTNARPLVISRMNAARGRVSQFSRTCTVAVAGDNNNTNTPMKNARRLLALGLAVGMSALASAQSTGYALDLENNLDTIDGIWGTVATIMIGVALVTVGVRFFRKAK